MGACLLDQSCFHQRFSHVLKKTSNHPAVDDRKKRRLLFYETILVIAKSNWGVGGGADHSAGGVRRQGGRKEGAEWRADAGERGVD